MMHVGEAIAILAKLQARLHRQRNTLMRQRRGKLPGPATKAWMTRSINKLDREMTALAKAIWTLGCWK